MNITQVDGEDYDSDTAPYDIAYSEPNSAATPEAELQAILVPKNYPVIFDLNEGTVTEIDLENYEAQVDDDTVFCSYKNGNTWSYATKIEAVVPEREGYEFVGWKATVDGVAVEKNVNVTISADVCETVVLTAQWEQLTYEETVAADPEEGGTVTGAGTYTYGNEVQITADVNTGYTFQGWFEGEKQVSDKLEYSFVIFENHSFVAKFSLNQYTVSTVADPVAGGTTTGSGQYAYGEETTLAATVNPGYTFLGWYKNGEQISGNFE